MNCRTDVGADEIEFEYLCGDLDCDGDVDGYDLKIFCDQWLQSCPL